MRSNWWSKALTAFKPSHNGQDRVRKIYNELVADAINKGGKLFPGDGVFVVAARLDDANKIQELLSLGVDINQRGVKGVTALHIAAYLRNMEIIRLLLRNCANIEETDEDKETPLYSAITGLDGQIPEPYRSRPLLPVVKLLLNAGARPDAFSILYTTPANMTDNMDVRRLLLEQEMQYYEMKQKIVPVDAGWGTINYENDYLKRLAEDQKSKDRHLPPFFARDYIDQEIAVEGDRDFQFNMELVRNGPLMSPGDTLLYQPPPGKAAISFVSLTNARKVVMESWDFDLSNTLIGSKASSVQANNRRAYLEATENASGNVITLRMYANALPPEEYLKHILQILHFHLLIEEKSDVLNAIDSAIEFSPSFHLCFVHNGSDLSWWVNGNCVAAYT